MKRYLVSKTGIMHSEHDEQLDRLEEGFYFTSVDLKEWINDKDSIFCEIGVIDSELIDQISLWGDVPIQAGLTARIITLCPNVYFVTYCEYSEKGKGFLIPFFLTSKEFILLNRDTVSLTKIDGWAKRGILKNPIDMAKVLGLRVLRQHQMTLENVEFQMDQLEKEILNRPNVIQETRILNMHRRVIEIKKSLNNHLSVFTRLTFIEKEQGGSAWKDLLTDTERELENVRQLHELVEGLREAYQVAMDNRNNDIMKLLTLLATILLPINLLTSFFGMNFKNMPLLESAIGLYVFYCLCIAIIVIVFLYYRHKRWLD